MRVMNQNMNQTQMQPTVPKTIDFRFMPEDGGVKVSNSAQTVNLNSLAGCTNNDVVQELIASATIAKTFGSDALKLNVLTQTLAETAPKDLHEARLCLQGNVLFSEGMNYLAKANHHESPLQADFCMRSAIKLLRLHNETLEALSRYRRKGEQKVIVQHVNINEGGQAIVGNVMPRGGAHQNVT